MCQGHTHPQDRGDPKGPGTASLEQARRVLEQGTSKHRRDKNDTSMRSERGRCSEKGNRSSRNSSMALHLQGAFFPRILVEISEPTTGWENPLLLNLVRHHLTDLHYCKESSFITPISEELIICQQSHLMRCESEMYSALQILWCCSSLKSLALIHSCINWYCSQFPQKQNLVSVFYRVVHNLYLTQLIWTKWPRTPAL